jgi:thiamine kinase-like enzyme
MNPITVEEERIRDLGCWTGPITIAGLTGGITNRNYAVRDAEGAYVVRVCEELPHLGIDRDNEQLCQEAAFRAGVAPKVVQAQEGILVSRFIAGRPLCAGELYNAAILKRLGALLRQLHEARDERVAALLEFCPFQTVRTYAATARALNARMPEGIDADLEDASRLSRAMSPFQPSLCHNDLMPSNILDDDETLWLVDWEYAGIGNPLFDLASVSSNAWLPDELEALLLESYFGSSDETMRQQLRVLKSISHLREALWSIIQTVTSQIDFDYDQYAATNLAAFRETCVRLTTD